MHKSVHKSCVPDSYTLYVCMYACMYQELLKNHNKFLVCLRTLGELKYLAGQIMQPIRCATEDHVSQSRSNIEWVCLFYLLNVLFVNGFHGKGMWSILNSITWHDIFSVLASAKLYVAQDSITQCTAYLNIAWQVTTLQRHEMYILKGSVVWQNSHENYIRDFF